MQQSIAPPASRHPLWLLAGFWVLVFIALAVVFRRLAALLRPTGGGPPQMAALDSAFSSHALLTVVHIIPAAIFVLLSAVVLLRRDGSGWAERLMFPLGVVTGVTAYAMSAYAVGGWVERSAVFVFDTWFLWSLGCAYWFQRRGERLHKRDWMTRAVGVLLGIAATRPVMGVFFATSSRTHLASSQFFGIAFWIGFSINVVIIELWLHSKQRARMIF